ncbi:PepSY-associated transmembrane protein [Tahibacter aquaticus]|uniref:PepSY-associated transmembrane protein n=1 Tax=Tahibacter aquaticus TaxID=520092 RepID=A0A4R6Z243_9GAMM|nr:PepSY domain-containing protein [Tahibacter aquaticus]TDR45640.1 PepSY-associated transmembrane protein [Tahibacter aquaticus]
MISQRALRQWHRALGWFVGWQVVVWMMSGLYMSAAPIDWIHGDHWVHEDDRVLEDRPVLSLAALRTQFPTLTGFTLKSLAQQPVFEIRDSTGVQIIDAQTGDRLSPLLADTVRALAQARFTGTQAVVSVDWLEHAPAEVSTRPAPLWRVTFAGAAKPTLYYSPETGELLAKRFAGWRLFDALWMLHIMDYATRSDVNNPLLRAAAGVGVLFAGSGLLLLIVARRRPRPGLRLPARPWPYRLHRGFAWAVGVQLILWIGSGLTMSLLDHSLVDGSRYARVPPSAAPIDLSSLLEPQQVLARLGQPVRRLTLQSSPQGPFYLVQTADAVHRFDARTGAHAPVDAAAALAVAQADYLGSGQLQTPEWLPQADQETRGHAGAFWRVPIDDSINSTLYVSADNGTVVERRNRIWRIFDVAWMLHIMDYRHRTSFNHPLLILMALGGIWLVGSGVWVAARRWRKESSARPAR